ESGEDKLELNEAIGSHFSIKADEDKIEEKNRISFAESDRNFEMAVKSRWYHQSFVNFCKTHDIKCYYRSVFAEPEQPRVLENVMDTMLWAGTLQ
ncbi:MAG: hypothetical protein H7249_07485, partial [Chitinophagaceae bacterium]|nr:hypothetical protein [Oligoflexus sp.]